MAEKLHTWVAVVLICLMSDPVAFAQEEEASSSEFFGSLKEYLLKEFNSDLNHLNNTWQAFRKARDGLNVTASATPWLTGTNNSVFNLTLLMEFKGKVMDMVDRKKEFLAQKALLKQEMYTALFNLSIRYYEELREAQSNKSSGFEGDGGVGGTSEWAELINTLFGSSAADNDDDDDEAGDKDDDEDNQVEREEVALSDSTSDADDKENDNDEDVSQASDESEDEDGQEKNGADTIVDSFLSQYYEDDDDDDDSSEEEQSDELQNEPESEKASDSEEDSAENDSPAYDWRKNPWARFAINRDAKTRDDTTNDWKKYAKQRFENKDWKGWAKNGKEEWKKYANKDFENKKFNWKKYAMAREAERKKEAEEMPTVTLTGRESAVIDITARLWEKFEPAVQSLNSTWNDFLTSKQEMAVMAAKRAWETKSATGQKIFDPVALLEFKVKIRDMVLKKNNFVAEKVQLKQDMVQELGLILQAYLSQQETDGATSATGSGESTLFGDYSPADVIEPILEQLQKVESPTASSSSSSNNGTGSNANLLDGLPFSESLQLAAATPDAYFDDDNGSEKDSSAEVIAVATLGVVAVAVGVMVVAVVAMRKSHRQALYTRVP